MSLATQVFTNAGIDMLGQANAGTLLTITKIVVGSGSASSDSDIYPLTALIHYQADVTITRKVDQHNGRLLISGVLNEWELTGPPFQLRELGVMANTTGGSGLMGGGGTPIITPPPTPEPRTGGDQLYCASNVYTDPPDTVTPGGLNSHAFDIVVNIDRATSVTVIIGDASTVDCQNVPADASVGPGWYDHREGNIFDFKRAIQGPGIILTDLGVGQGIKISASTLTVNTDLYVPASYPGPPPGPVFPSIQAAHDYLLQFTIPPNVQANIHVWIGTLNSGPIVFTHPNSKQINLIGQPRVDRGFDNISSAGGATKTIALSDTTGFGLNQLVYISGCAPGWAGGCKITSMSPGRQLVCSVLKRDTRADYTIDNGNVGKVSYLPTVVAFSGTPAPGQYLLYCPNGIGSIQNMLFVGGWYTLVIESGLLFNVMCMGSGTFATKRGLSTGAGLVSLTGECVFTDLDFGLTGIGPVGGFEQLYFNACSQGISPNGASYQLGEIQVGLDNAIIYLSHCSNGLYVTDGGSFLGGQIWMDVNDVGLSATNGSIMQIGPGHMPCFKPGVTRQPIDCYAQGMSYIQFKRNHDSHGVLESAPICNPPADAYRSSDFNAQNSFIHVVSAGGS